jgi:hypothetical protein
MHALPTFWTMDFRSLYLVNQTYIILLCKKKEVVQVRDFRPISLIHSFGKLILKILSGPSSSADPPPGMAKPNCLHQESRAA